MVKFGMCNTRFVLVLLILLLALHLNIMSNLLTANGVTVGVYSKLGQIVNLCSLWADKTYCSKRDLQSLLGHLLYIAKCVKPARIFLNRMLQTLRDNASKTKILLNGQFFRDLNWFNVFLSQYNGVTFYDNLICHAEIHLDASLTGLGAIFDNMGFPLIKTVWVITL